MNNTPISEGSLVYVKPEAAEKGFLSSRHTTNFSCVLFNVLSINQNSANISKKDPLAKELGNTVTIPPKYLIPVDKWKLPETSIETGDIVFLSPEWAKAGFYHDIYNPIAMTPSQIEGKVFNVFRNIYNDKVKMAEVIWGSGVCNSYACHMLIKSDQFLGLETVSAPNIGELIQEGDTFIRFDGKLYNKEKEITITETNEVRKLFKL